jgi:hypothetical protein
MLLRMAVRLLENFKKFRAANASSVRRIEKTQSVTEQRAGSIPPALKQGHGRAYYTNGPLVAGASSLPAKTSSRNKK